MPPAYQFPGSYGPFWVSEELGRSVPASAGTTMGGSNHASLGVLAAALCVASWPRQAGGADEAGIAAERGKVDRQLGDRRGEGEPLDFRLDFGEEAAMGPIYRKAPEPASAKARAAPIFPACSPPP